MIRIKTLVLVMAILLLTLSACDSIGSASPGIGSTSLPYKDLSANEIASVTVKIPPRGFQVELSNDEVEELVAILRTVDTDNPAGSGIEYEGEAIRFTLTMTNGAVKTITAYNPVIFMENHITVIPYKTDACYALSEFGISAAESEYQQFLKKIANSVYAFSDSISHVTTGQVVTIGLNENQSFPSRWMSDISDGSLMELIHDEIDRGRVPSNAQPGTGGEVHIFYFEALRSGECTIDINYVNIGGKDDEILEIESYTIIIED